MDVFDSLKSNLMTQSMRNLLLVVVPAALMLGGCAAPLIGALTLNQIISATTVATMATTGKGPGEIVLGSAVRRDCRILEGTLRSDRKICEVTDSPATERDFKGLTSVVAFVERRTGEEDAHRGNRQLAFDLELASGE